jgi:hypothetical protein
VIPVDISLVASILAMLREALHAGAPAANRGFADVR